MRIKVKDISYARNLFNEKPTGTVMILVDAPKEMFERGQYLVEVKTTKDKSNHAPLLQK